MVCAVGQSRLREVEEGYEEAGEIAAAQHRTTAAQLAGLTQQIAELAKRKHRHLTRLSRGMPGTQRCRCCCAGPAAAPAAAPAQEEQQQQGPPGAPGLAEAMEARMEALEAKMTTLGTELSEANARAEAENQARQRAEERTEALRERLEATEAMLVSRAHPSLCSYSADSHGLRCVRILSERAGCAAEPEDRPRRVRRAVQRTR